MKWNTSIVLKYTIIDGDELITRSSSPDNIYDGTRVDKYDGKSDGFPVGASDGAALKVIDIILLGVSYSIKLWEDLGCM